MSAREWPHHDSGQLSQHLQVHDLMDLCLPNLLKLPFILSSSTLSTGTWEA